MPAVRPFALPGLRVPTLHALVEALEAIPSDGPWMAADLSLGAWRGRAVAHEILAQLGRPRADIRGTADLLPRSPDPDAIGQAVDAENLGDPGLRALAQEVVERIGGASRTIAVLCPREGHGWEAEDAAFVRILADEARGSPIGIILVAAGEPVIPPDWRVEWRSGPTQGVARVGGRDSSPSPPWRSARPLAGLVPGVLDEALAHQLGPPAAEHPLPGGQRLVAPELRPLAVAGAEWAALRPAHDQLATLTLPRWLEAYAQTRGSPAYADEKLLIEEAARRLAEGGPGIALRVLDWIARCARAPIPRAVAQLRVQALRVALRRYREAADAEPPAAGLPASLRRLLLQSKGWGLALEGRAQEAEPMLAEALALASDEADFRERLYLRNVHALTIFLAGDAPRALEIERQIAKDLAGHDARRGVRDEQLRYVNEINQARLHRHLGDLDAAAICYAAAFETTRGLRPLGDRVYANLCLAGLAERAGGPAAAYAPWLRTVLHWVAAPAPETLPPRAASAIVRRRVGNGEHVEDEVSDALAAALRRVARSTDPEILDRAETVADPPDVVERDSASGTDAQIALGRAGWGLLGAGGRPRRPIRRSEGREALARLVASIVAGSADASGWGDVRTLVVDDRFGEEIPIDRDELRGLAVRAGAARVWFAGEEERLDEGARLQAALDSPLRLAAGVATIDPRPAGAIVSFRRYRAPTEVGPREARILRALADRPQRETVRTLATDAKEDPLGALATSRLLESARLVAFGPPPALAGKRYEP